VDEKGASSSHAWSPGAGAADLRPPQGSGTYKAGKTSVSVVRASAPGGGDAGGKDAQAARNALWKDRGGGMGGGSWFDEAALVLKSLRKNKSRIRPFEEPVDLLEAPGYLDVVSSPLHTAFFFLTLLHAN
jgi:hypothetical protein